MKNEGWAKFWRKQWEHWVSDDRPFCRGYAWTYLWSETNHKKKKVFWEKVIPIERGEMVTSILQLSRIWGWSRKKVSKFLDELEKEGMLTQKRTSKYTFIVITNYEKHQGKKEEETSTEHQKNTNKNVKNEKEIKHIVVQMNKILNTQYLPTTKNTQSLIRKRLSNGYTIENFETVIKNRKERWENDRKMYQYLTPDTLFAEKNFEKYLQDAKSNKKKKGGRIL